MISSTGGPLSVGSPNGSVAGPRGHVDPVAHRSRIQRAVESCDGRRIAGQVGPGGGERAERLAHDAAREQPFELSHGAGRSLVGVDVRGRDRSAPSGARPPTVQDDTST